MIKVSSIIFIFFFHPCYEHNWFSFFLFSKTANLDLNIYKPMMIESVALCLDICLLLEIHRKPYCTCSLKVLVDDDFNLLKPIGSISESPKKHIFRFPIPAFFPNSDKSVKLSITNYLFSIHIALNISLSTKDEYWPETTE